MSMRNFGDAARAADQRKQRGDSYIEWAILDRPIKFYEPDSAAFIKFAEAQVAANGDGSEMERSMASVVPFMEAITRLVDHDDAKYIMRQLSTPFSGFDIKDAMELWEALAQEWSGRPTKPASDSSSSRENTGKRSTAGSRRASSIRGNSDLPASSI